MTAAKSGTIINISSVSDRKTSPVRGLHRLQPCAPPPIVARGGGHAGRARINVAPAYIKTNIHQGMGITPPPPR